MNLYPILKVLLISLAILIVPYAGATSFGTSVLIANYSILTLSVVFTLKISHRNSKSKNFSFFCLIFSTYLYVVAMFPEDLNPQNFVLSNFLNFIDDKMKPNLAYQIFQPFILLILTVENIDNSQSRDTNERNFPSILRFLVITILLAMPCLLFLSKGYQVPLTAALATSGLITAIIGLALQGNLSNVVSGIFLNLEKPFEKNDWITVDGQLGQVKNISWRTTNLVSIDNMEIAIPNDKLAQATVINLARNDPNFSSGGFVTYDPIVVHPRHKPENIMALLKDALAKAVPADKRSFFGYTDVWFGGAKDGGLEFWIAYDCMDRALLFSQRSSIMMSINHVLTKAGVTMSVGHILQTIKPDASLLAIQDYSQDQRTYDKLYAPAHNIYLESQKPEFWFRRVNLFKALNDEEFTLISSASDKRFFREGELIIKQGAQGSSMFLIAEGVVEVSLKNASENEIIVGNLTIGEVFGEMSLLTGAPRVATAKAKRPVVLFEINKEIFSKILKNNDAVLESLSQILASRQLELANIENSLESAESTSDRQRGVLQAIKNSIIKFFQS
ncbi:mechanosensitive ion channel family protein [bacterium]|nr:mechanosensitive ion channel family protein [bacterium]